jgi:hypothetical protein
MPSAWIITRTTSAGERRFRVLFRVGGRESRATYGGTFKTKREADERKRWIAGELAALRMPDTRALTDAQASVATVSAAGERWLASRIDVAEATKTRHGLELARIDRLLGSRAVEQLAAAEIADFVATLAADYSRATIRKTLQTLAMLLDHEGVTPNPARAKEVRLPREDAEEISPPSAEHVGPSTG